MIKANLRSIVFGLLLSLTAPLSAFAQCSGQAPAQTYCGNPTASLALPGWKPVSSFPASCTAAGSFLVGTGSAAQCSAAAGSTAVLNGGALTINPTTGTINQGIVINQTVPSSGTSPGPVILNSITITNPGLSTTGSGWDASGQTRNQVIGFKINYFSTGTTTTNNAGFSVSNFVTGQTDAYGSIGGVVVNANVGTHYFWGHIGAGAVWAAGSTGLLTGLDGEVGIATGGSALWRFGVGADSQGPVQGTNLDSAFVATASSVTVPGGGTVTGWQHLMSIAKNVYFSGVSPIAPSGDFFFSDASMTVAHFANLSNVTVTGNILSFPNMAIGGNGTASFGAGSAGLPGTGVNVTCTSCGTVLISGAANAASVSSFNGFQATDTAGTNILVAGVANAANTDVRFGQTTGNWGEVIVTGSTTNGLLLGTVTSDSVIIGTNNTARITITNAGVTTISGSTGIGSAIAPDTTLMVNSNTGAPAAPVLNVDAHLVAANALNGGIMSDVYGGEVFFIGRASDGTQASKSARGAASPYMALIARTWDGAAYATAGALEFVTINLQSGSDHSARARLSLVPVSAPTTLTDVMLWGPGVAIGSGAADPGAGNLNLGGGVLQNNGTAPTGTGAYVRATSPTLVTPNLGTPSALVLTSATGLPISTGLTGAGTGILAALAVNVGSAGAPVLFNGALGTPSSGVGTNITNVNAATLGGATFAAPGAIGGTTPAAGTFTTLVANTSVSSPIHASPGTHTFQSNGSTFAGQITTGQQWALGANASPLAGPILTLNQNTVAAPIAVSSAPALHVVGADNALTGALSDAFGSAAQNVWTARLAFGTGASPTQVNAAAVALTITSQALDNGGPPGTYRTIAAIDFGSVGAITSTTWSGFWRVRTGTTSSTFAERMRVQLGVSIGDTTDPGIGGLRATGATIQFTALASDAATTDNTVCVSSTGTILKGSGTLGICLGTSGMQFKTAFAPMVGGVDDIARLNFQNYRYREGFGDGGARVQYGLTAQDVETVLPDLVHHDAFGAAINFDSGALLFIGLRAIQQLKADNDNLRAEMDAMRRAGK